MSYTVREPEVAAHIAEAQRAFVKHRIAQAAVHSLSRGFVWHRGQESEHLHRAGPNGEVLKDLGPRDEKLERIAAAHTTKRETALAQFENWSRERHRLESLNVAHGAGRLLITPTNVLEVLWRRGLMDYYTVIGTYAMYAYEVAAGVVFDEPTMATNDVDLFYSADKQLKFAQVVRGKHSMLEVLQEADETFERNEDQKESAMNSEGFSIDFLRRDEAERFSDAYSISGTDGDLWPAQGKRSSWFLGSPRFEQPVIAVDGTMTSIRTIDPKTFMLFKRWMSEQKDRETLRRTRDKLQALAVEQLLSEGRLHSKL